MIRILLVLLVMMKSPPPEPVPEPNAEPPEVRCVLAGARVSAKIHKVRKRQYQAERALRDEVLTNVDDWAGCARIVPVFRDGTAIGFKVFEVVKGSVWDAAGLHNGDIVRTLNGLDLNSPDKALEMYSHLRGADRLVVQLEREGKQLEFIYEFVPARTGAPSH